MKRPTVGAAVTERWSQRGSELRHVIRRRQLQDDLVVQKEATGADASGR